MELVANKKAVLNLQEFTTVILSMYEMLIVLEAYVSPIFRLGVETLDCVSHCGVWERFDTKPFKDGDFVLQKLPHCLHKIFTEHIDCMKNRTYFYKKLRNGSFRIFLPIDDDAQKASILSYLEETGIVDED
jgi:hypothetical protein